MPPLVSFPPTPELYKPFYEHELLGVGVSGREIQGEQGHFLFESIRQLVADNISILLTFGGGKQNDEEYGRRFGRQREKVGGYAVTDERALPCIVDVQNDIRDHILRGLREILPKDCPIDVISPEHVVCRYTDFDTLKYVGTPIRVDHDITAPVTVVGYTGVVGEQIVNVNKDEIARILGSRTVENFLVTPTRGVIENFKDPLEQWRTVPVMFADEIGEDGTHSKYSIADGMRPKLKNAKAMAADARVVITVGADIPDEIFNIGGKGTLIIERSKIVADHPTSRERDIARFVIVRNEEVGNFRRRTEEERALVLRHHLVLREHTPLAGCSLVPFEDGSMELSTLWSGYNGMGQILAAEAQKYFLSRSDCHTLFALSKRENPDVSLEQDETIQRFQRYGFRFLGTLNEAKARGEIPQHLQTYNTEARNPCLFLVTREELSRKQT